jgi:hypothetical protein
MPHRLKRAVKVGLKEAIAGAAATIEKIAALAQDAPAETDHEALAPVVTEGHVLVVKELVATVAHAPVAKVADRAVPAAVAAMVARELKAPDLEAPKAEGTGGRELVAKELDNGQAKAAAMPDAHEPAAKVAELEAPKAVAMVGREPVAKPADRVLALAAAMRDAHVPVAKVADLELVRAVDMDALVLLVKAADRGRVKAAGMLDALEPVVKAAAMLDALEPVAKVADPVAPRVVAMDEPGLVAKAQAEATADRALLAAKVAHEPPVVKVPENEQEKAADMPDVPEPVAMVPVQAAPRAVATAELALLVAAPAARALAVPINLQQVDVDAQLLAAPNPAPAVVASAARRSSMYC